MCAVVCVVHVCKCVPRCPLVPDYSVPHQKRGQLRTSRRAVGAGTSDHGTFICKCMAVQSASDARPNASRRCLRTEHQKPKGETNSPNHVPKNASEASCTTGRDGGKAAKPPTPDRLHGERALGRSGRNALRAVCLRHRRRSQKDAKSQKLARPLGHMQRRFRHACKT